MPRAVLILTAGLVLSIACLVAGASGSAIGTPTTTVPTTTTVAIGPTTSTTVVVATTTVPRGGATAGSVAKPEAAEGWSIERLATLTALGIVALAAAGYAFGRFRSTPPVHPDLARNPE